MIFNTISIFLTPYIHTLLHFCSQFITLSFILGITIKTLLLNCGSITQVLFGIAIFWVLALPMKRIKTGAEV